MTLLDWALLLVVLGTALSGFWAGAVRIVFGVGGALAGLWLAVVAGADVAMAFGAYVQPQWLAEVVARTLLLVICTGLCLAAGWGIDRTLRAVKLGWVNRAFGAMLAGVAAAVVLTVLLVTGARFSPPFADLCDRSLLPPHLFDLVAGTLPEESLPPPEQVEDEPDTEENPGADG